jgi:hypothetical protein
MPCGWVQLWERQNRRYRVVCPFKRNWTKEGEPQGLNSHCPYMDWLAFATRPQLITVAFFLFLNRKNTQNLLYA